MAPTWFIEGADKWNWSKVPSSLKERGAVVFIPSAPTNGVADFKITKDGYLLLACNYDDQGNRGGNWDEEVWDEKHFKEQGWQRLTESDLGGALVKSDNRAQLILAKQMHRGETMRLRCNKYDPPFPILLVADGRLSPQGLERDKAEGGSGLPEKVLPLTDEQLKTKVPHFYCFEYLARPQPGFRYWMRVDKSTWIEQYPDGQQSSFKVLGHTVVEGTEGTLVVKVSGAEAKTGTTNDGGLQAFIPDLGQEKMRHWYRNLSRGDKKWNDLGPMLSVR